MPRYVYAHLCFTHLYITEVLHLVTYVQLFMTVKMKVTAHVVATLLLLGWFLQWTRVNVPTNVTDYSCHIKAVELV